MQFSTRPLLTGFWRWGELARGASFAVTFTGVGSFDHLCTIHPSTTGSVTVTPG